jgi:hypothetical protein
MAMFGQNAFAPGYGGAAAPAAGNRPVPYGNQNAANAEIARLQAAIRHLEARYGPVLKTFVFVATDSR